jgi:nucleoid DNA-binding protein
MSIDYYIANNKMKNGASYTGRVNLKSSYKRKDIISMMSQRGKSEGEINGLLDALEETITKLCLEGSSVTLDGFATFKPVIKGKFESITDNFKKNKHSTGISVSISRKLNNYFNKTASISRTIIPESMPEIKTFHDIKTGEYNNKISKGYIAEIYGNGIKFDDKSGEEYLRIVNAEDTKEYIQIKHFQKITKNMIVFSIPSDIPFKKCRFEISAKMRTKIPKISKSDFSLDIV